MTTNPWYDTTPDSTVWTPDTDMGKFEKELS